MKYKPNLDLCHAWGTAPINIISRYVLGVTPLEPGFAKILVRPQIGSLARVEGMVPTAKGPVKVRINDGVLALDLPAPARVEWMGTVRDVPAGKVAVPNRQQGRCAKYGIIGVQITERRKNNGRRIPVQFD